MQFVIIAKDYKDKKALSRRMAAREHHIMISNEEIDNYTGWHCKMKMVKCVDR